jgi:hypothetical protein
MVVIQLHEQLVEFVTAFSESGAENVVGLRCISHGKLLRFRPMATSVSHDGRAIKPV